MHNLAAGIGLEAALRALAQAFRDKGLATPALDARLLVLTACGISHAEMIRDAGRPLTNDQRARLCEMAKRRLAGEPVSRIMGRRAFWGLEFTVSPETLDPRPDTETLVEAVLAALPERDAPLRILDLGTGTGCVLVALLHELPRAAGIGTDISHAALITARGNAEQAGVADRARFVRADWLSGIDGRFDVIVANPPYIARRELNGLSPEVRDHDPAAALDGGADGLSAYRAILRDIDRVVRPGGLLAFEVGHGQAGSVAAMMREAGLTPLPSCSTACVRDLAGIARVVIMGRAFGSETAKKELEICGIHDSL